ncbi:MAG TPA: UDP-glucose/GDP-mannose dehydrogenase family protein [Streptosporangiaceae bacterium]
MRITVIGTGYLGAVHAACMAHIGHEVLGVDTDAAKVAALSAGQTPFFEPEFEDILCTAQESGRLRFGTSLAEAADFGDVHFICVGTPQLTGTHFLDLNAVHDAIAGLVPHITRDSLIVGKSTVPVGTAAELTATIAKLAPGGPAIDLAWNPEFLRQGHAVQDALRPDRVVAGTNSARGDQLLREIYAPLTETGIPYVGTDLNSAELVKVAANAFVATKISFINLISDICEASGADVVDVSHALGLDTRIGSQALSSGLGFGGSCLGKDIRSLAAWAYEAGASDPVAFFRAVDDINSGRRRRAVDMARSLVGGSLRGKRVAVLGVAFKPDTDDVRDSPALGVAESMAAQGADVRIHDPYAAANALAVCPQLDSATEVTKACEDADLVVHLTQWKEYQELDPAELRSVVRRPVLLDARNALPLGRWRSAGWTVRAFGRRSGNGPAGVRLVPQVRRQDPAPLAGIGGVPA